MIHRKIIGHLTPHIHADGGHHRAHALSLLSLFSYLQILIVLTVGLRVVALKIPQVLGVASFGQAEIITLTNQKRAENGLPPLTQNGNLSQAAAAKAADMFANDYWSHNSPNGKTPWTFITAAGYRYVYAGENLARDFNDASSTVNAWMDSSSHRNNLLDKNFKEIGVAVDAGKLTGHEGILVVQMFGAGISQINVPVQTAQASPSPVPTPETAGQRVAQASPTSAPSPQSSPVVSPTPSAVPAGIPQETVLQNENPQVPILATRQFSIAKIASLSLVGFIFLLFALEAIIALRSVNMRLRSGVIAHLALLAFVLITLWYAVGGAII